MKEKKKEGKVISINLDLKELELMEFDKSKEGFKNTSEYIGWLIRSRNYSTNPAEYLKSLDKEEQEHNEEIKKIREKRKEAIRNLELTKEIDIIKNKKRPEAINIIKGKFISEGIISAEQYAKNWGIMLNCPPTELIFEAVRAAQKDKIT